MGKRAQLSKEEVAKVRLFGVKDFVEAKKYNHLQGVVVGVANMVAEYDGKITGGSYSKRWMEASWLLCNIADYAVAYKSKYVLKGLNPRSWCGGGTKATLSEFLHVLEVLESAGIVKVYRGGIECVDIFGYRFIRSVIEFDKKFLDEVKEKRKYASNKTRTRRELEKSIARDSENKEEIRLINSAKIEMYNNISDKFNDFMSGVDILHEGDTLPIQQYRPIFIDNEDKGGRWYNINGGVQTLHKSLRGGLSMNGEKLVEVDFKAMHPNMLLQEMYNKDRKKVGRWMKDNPYYNPYTLNSVSKVGAEHLTECELREAVKVALLICLNADSRRSATMALNKKLREMGGYEGVKVPELINRVLDSNIIIKEFMFTGEGVYLQNRDSLIMANILKDSVKSGIPILPLHDGALVRESDAGKVVEIFKKSWYNSYRDTTFCKVEVGR